jgi:hypothetical protein
VSTETDTHHRTAMARMARAMYLMRDALYEEEQAARSLPPTPDSEPSRSVLYRSAAAIAVQCGQLERAKHLACEGLTGATPPEIAEELRAVIKRSEQQ